MDLHRHVYEIIYLRSLPLNKQVMLVSSASRISELIQEIQEHFTIHCDSSLMAQQLYMQHKDHLTEYNKTTTHWHRLAAYGLEEDMLYCISKDTAPSLPLYKDSALINAL